MSSTTTPYQSPRSITLPVHKRAREQTPTRSRPPRAVAGFLIDESESDAADDDVLIYDAPPRKRLARGPSSDVEILESANDASRVPAEEILNRLMNQREETPIEVTAASPAVFQVPELLDPPRVELASGYRRGAITHAKTSSGKLVPISVRRRADPIPMEQLVGARSTVKAGRARKSYYGIQIYDLIEEAKAITKQTKAGENTAVILPSLECPETASQPRKSLMWTEKYRAMNFLELVGDDRTHRQVLRWLKSWDPIVFPNSSKKQSVSTKLSGSGLEDPKPHRKILLLTGPPGLGKTTLAHVCARQAGYEVMEINASDDRSRDVVNGRIKTSINTESVKNGSIAPSAGRGQKSARPLCLVVDEVDGVVGSSGGSEEKGFMNALVELIQLDLKNTGKPGPTAVPLKRRKKKTTDTFKFQRPLILICNDVYHASLRQLRQSQCAEVIHVRKASLDAVLLRVKVIFEKEGIACDEDAVRRLCEATWGVTAAEARKHREGTGGGDLRSILVVAEWAARKLRASASTELKLTRHWVEQNIVGDLAHGGDGARGVGPGDARDVAKRVFLDGAGFPRSTGSTGEVLSRIAVGVAEGARRAGLQRLREMVETLGDTHRVMTDIFSQYPSQPFHDDSLLSKPNSAYEWFYFHDACASHIYANQAFELLPYLCQPVLACHYLFATPGRHRFGNHEVKTLGEDEAKDVLPFTGPRADYEAHEAEKSHRAVILALQSNLTPTNLRSFKNTELIAIEILPYLVRMLTPDIKPVVVGGVGDRRAIASVRREAEKAMVKRTVEIMSGLNIIFEQGKLESDFGSVTTWVYRMEPPLDNLTYFKTASSSHTVLPPVRYALRQVLDQEYQKEIVLQESAIRYARYHAGKPKDEIETPLLTNQKKMPHTTGQVEVKKDYFGRVISQEIIPLLSDKNKKDQKSFITFHEGYSNAVRKPLTVDDLLRGL
ncbi:Chromosome transmission fidelity protein 18 [Podosphaera aphanis]|nr:Chromosome transmission fidelity protein 18 [Podosphaera aphanis]